MERCFGTDLNDLARRSDTDHQFSLSIENATPPWTLTLHNAGDDIRASVTRFDASHIELERRSLNAVLRAPRNIDLPDDYYFDLYQEFVSSLWLSAFSDYPSEAYYLPAARSGILQSHKALARLVISRASRIGIERFDIPQLSGVVMDFIANILTLTHRNAPLAPLAKMLESDVIGGEVDIEPSQIEYPEIYYQVADERFPLHRTSSMVSELAPIALFLKYLIRPGQLFIIEEPESHLHPENQLRLARLIVQLVRAGVSVVATTHSDYFLARLSNFIRLASVDQKQRMMQGFGENDYLLVDDVAAYLFNVDPVTGGSIIERLPITEADGIPEYDLDRVAESLYSETVQIEREIMADNGISLH